MDPLPKAWTDLVNHGKEDRDEFLSALPTSGSQILEKLDTGTPKVLVSRRYVMVVWSNILAHMGEIKDLSSNK